MIMNNENLLQPEIKRILFEMDFNSKDKSIQEKYCKEKDECQISDYEIINTFEESGDMVKKKNNGNFRSLLQNNERIQSAGSRNGGIW